MTTALVETCAYLGSETYLYLKAGEHSFISRVDAHVKAEYGDVLELPVDMPKTHFFDGESEATIQLPR
jgi:multiple sugar transport system ATP-binding protein